MKRNDLRALNPYNITDKTKTIKRSLPEFSREIGVPTRTINGWKREDPSFPKIIFVSHGTEFFIHADLKAYWDNKKNIYVQRK